MTLLIKGFREMTDEELRSAAVALVAQYEHTGNETLKLDADAAMEEQARRMAARPNPYGRTAMSSTPNFNRREQTEVLCADTSRRLWVMGPGAVFWLNALAHARTPEQSRAVEAALAAAKKRGAAADAAHGNN
jgi:alkylation response protein AidB-like acyl-CoA dehydrogenase